MNEWREDFYFIKETQHIYLKQGVYKTNFATHILKNRYQLQHTWNAN